MESIVIRVYYRWCPEYTITQTLSKQFHISSQLNEVFKNLKTLCLFAIRQSSFRAIATDTRICLVSTGMFHLQWKRAITKTCEWEAIYEHHVYFEHKILIIGSLTSKQFRSTHVCRRERFIRYFTLRAVEPCGFNFWSGGCVSLEQYFHIALFRFWRDYASYF